MIELLGQLERPESLPVLLDLLARSDEPGIQLAVLVALGQYQEPAIAAPLLAAYRSAPAVVRQRILGLSLLAAGVGARAAGGGRAAASSSPKALSPAHVQLIAQLSDPALLDRLEAVWGKVPRAGSPEKKRRIAEIRGLLAEGDKGNAAARQADLQGALRGLPQALRRGRGDRPRADRRRPRRPRFPADKPGRPQCPRAQGVSVADRRPS